MGTHTAFFLFGSISKTANADRFTAQSIVQTVAGPAGGVEPVNEPQHTQNV